VGVKERGLGIALKFEDGGIRGIPAAILSVLQELEVLSPEETQNFESWRRKTVKNDLGWTVGEIRPSFKLERS